jgi:hypothetical protein
MSWLIRATSFCDSPGTEPSSGHPDQDDPAIGIGKRRHFRSQRFGIPHIRLELTAAVFAATDLFDQ